jgi:hypothetical protein
MKRNVTAMGMPLSKEELNELLKETKETVAIKNAALDAAGTFGAVDLWNLQKKHRSSLDLRRRMN